MEPRRRPLFGDPLAAVDHRERHAGRTSPTRAPARFSNADIQFYHNVMELARDWYFTQVGPLDPRAQKLPLPDDLMGRLLEYVVAHEVGHTLGFQHNMKASSIYPFEKIRDQEWVHKMGHTPSIMDYSRFNYVAQPEDEIAVEDLIPRIGPYDIWATMWGYTPIPGAKTADDEKADARQVGQRAGRQAVAALLHRQRRGLRPRRRDRGRGRRRCREGHHAGGEEPAAGRARCL